MATHKDMNFNVGVVSDWFDSVLSDVSSRLSLTAGSALRGTAEGLRCEVTSTGSIAQGLTVMAAPASDELRVIFWFDASNVSIITADSLVFRATIRFSGSSPLLQISLSTNSIGGSSDYKIGVVTHEDGEIFDTTLVSNYEINNVEGNIVHCIGCRIVRETSSSGNDGIMQIFVDGIRISNSTTIMNFTAFSNIDRLVYTVFTNVASGLSGYLSFDEWFVDDDSNVDLSCDPVGNMLLAPMLKRAAIDSDGLFIYIAGLGVLSSPILVKISTALDANGTKVFDPTIGSNIGVQCGKSDANVVWIGGNFGGTDVVEKSEDAGSSFSVKDPATFGNVTAFVVGPEDERVLLVDDTVDIQETIDDGANWTEKNSAIGFPVNTLARFSLNLMRIVFGNASAVNDNIDYSPNSGVNLEDYSAGFPQSDVTSIVVR